METVSYYSLLGVSRRASVDEIKKAYRRLVFQYHPDRNPGDAKAAEKFKEILDAYGVLSDTIERARYDRTLEDDPEEEKAKQKSHSGSQQQSNGNGFGQQFNDTFQSSSSQYQGKAEPEPKCPGCSIIGIEHIVLRKGGSGTSRGKQFVLSPFNVILCSQCGHVYGITGQSS